MTQIGRVDTFIYILGPLFSSRKEFLSMDRAAIRAHTQELENSSEEGGRVYCPRMKRKQTLCRCDVTEALDMFIVMKAYLPFTIKFTHCTGKWSLRACEACLFGSGGKL